MKKLLLFISILFLFNACNWFRKKPEIAEKLTEHFKNNLYENFDTTAYKPIFKRLLEEEQSHLLNPTVINAFYTKNEFLPMMVTKFYADSQLDSLRNYLQRSRDDGFNPEIFKLKEIEKYLNLLNGNNFKSIDEVYEVVANLELNSVIALNKYSNFMTYGSINPQNFLDRFYIKVKRPDSLSMDSVLNTPSITDILKNSQNTNPAYITLKKILKTYREQQIAEDDERVILVKVNMERRRWKMPLATDELVEVNIPDFSLAWLKGTDTLTQMKVCVGSKRESDYDNKRKVFLKSGKLADKPKNHETPQLFSVFNAIQANPVWNIPVSIAKSEIFIQAKNDPFYLSNNNIKVYYKGTLVADPDTIDWNKYQPEKMPYQFKQASGEGNALGKFKFIFDNSASIYLHDTNNKNAFRYSNRAISHGCVRVENPLKFAELMVNDEKQYDKLRMEVDLPPIDTTKNELFKKILAKKQDTLKIFQLKPTWFAPRKGIGIYIAYYTAWVDGNGTLQIRNDIYGHDPILWKALKRYM